MDQKLLMNCVLCFLIGFFFHSIIYHGFCVKVEGYEECESKGELMSGSAITGCLETDGCCVNRPVGGNHRCISRGNGDNCIDEQAAYDARVNYDAAKAAIRAAESNSN